MNGRELLVILALQQALLSQSETFACVIGLQAEKGICVDIDECEDNICGKYSRCNNTVGSYYCSCIDGFRSTDGVNLTGSSAPCLDINECTENQHNCSRNTRCENVIGTYKCTCVDGFVPTAGAKRSGHEETCEDIDECKLEQKKCDVNSLCVNTEGSYYCDCKPGFGLKSGKANYTGNEGPCVDRNECELDKTPCGMNAQCVNTNGSYFCVCNPGFELNSGKANYTENEGPCVDICEIDTLICGRNGTCNNTAGGHTCVCHPGFTNYRHPQGKCTDLRCDMLMSSSPFPPIDPVLLGALELVHNNCKLLHQSGNEKEMDGEALLEALLSALDQLLSGGPLNSNRKVSAILGLVEAALRMIGPMLKHPKTRRSNKHTELEMLVQRNSSTPQGPLSLSCSHTQLDCLWETAAGESAYPGFATVALLSYNNLETSCNHSFSGLTAQEGQSFQINSKVVTATVSNMNTTYLNEPVNFTFAHLNELLKGNYTCVYWEDEGAGSWSENGCVRVQSNDTHTVCSCKHLSSFAVLMALYDIKDPFLLQEITWVGLSLSLLCLFFCILTFSLIRSIKSTRTTIHLHLCISLFIANFIFLVGISSTNNRTGCAVVAGLLHFFYLAALCWMCIEGVHLFRMVVLVFNTTIKPLYMMLGGYGVPAIIVIISALFNAKGYGTERYCWLDLKDGFIWSFFGPVCIIIVVNVFFLLITVWRLAQKFSSLNPDLNKLSKIKAFTITAMAQLCVLGSMWIFGSFQFDDRTLAMSYLFTICNSLQGALVFLMHCLLSKQVREEYGKIMVNVCVPRKKYSEFSSNQSSNSKPQNSKSIQNTGESQI